MQKERFSLSKEWPYLGFVAPALIAYTLFVIVPLVLSFRYAFTNWDGINEAHWVGFANFTTAFKDRAMKTAFSNTFSFAALVTGIVTVLAIPLAVVLNGSMRTKNLQRAVFFFPSVPSALILGYIWAFILNPTAAGMFNQVLGIFGIPPVKWLARASTAFPSMIGVAVWQSMGWHACIYLANMQSIPQEYYEAATIDGANQLKQFRYITFPMLAPSMTISIMLLLTGSLKVFDLPFSLTSGGPGYATTMITQIIISKGISEKMYGKATALSIIFFIIIFILTTLQLTVMKRREEKL